MTARRASAAPLLDVEGSPISFPSEAFVAGRECITKTEWERRFALAHPDRTHHHNDDAASSLHEPAAS